MVLSHARDSVNSTNSNNNNNNPNGCIPAYRCRVYLKPSPVQTAMEYQNNGTGISVISSQSL